MTGLSTELKTEIQQGYRDFLGSRELKPRLGQKQMIAAISNDLATVTEDSEGVRLNKAGLTLIEAGTGTGKTLAYLLAVMPTARARDKQIVIATGTIALQEQLIHRDIPALLEATGWELEVALAKGRSRYLCPLRLEQCLDVADSKEQGLFLFEDEITFDATAESLQLYQDMADALEEGDWNGERESWPETLDHKDWQPLTVDRRQCTGRRCRHFNNCAFYQARDQLEEAGCIVANHDLVLSDLALGGGVILPAPQDTIYVFDEAHRLPDTALGHFSASCRLETTIKLFGKIHQSLKKMTSLFSEDSVTTSEIERVVIAARSAEEVLTLVLPLCRELVQAELVGQGENRHRFKGGKIDPSLQEAAIQCANKTGLLASRLTALQDSLNSLLQQKFPLVPQADTEQMLQQVGLWLGRAENAQMLWRYYAEESDASKPPIARWLAQVENDSFFDIELAAAPTHPGNILQQNLYDSCFAAVMTSATFKALGSFNDFIDRAGLPSYVNCHDVAGVFDYANVATLCVPDIGADGGKPSLHTDAIIEHLPGLIEQREGTLVLFSSRAQMEAVHQMLDDELQQDILMQSRYSVQRLLAEHKTRIDEGETSVIFGLASFAEGVDLPGNYCRHVIIAKLPFSVPDDPVHGTLSDWVEEQGDNSFMSLMLPQASLKLNQACGRLLRTESDTGTITILDRRIVSKRYGQQLLAGLPPYRRAIS